MAINIKYNESLEDKVSYTMSEGLELSTALYCITGPNEALRESRPAKQLLASIPPSLLKKLQEGSGVTNFWLLPGILLDEAPFAPFEVALSKGRSLSIEEMTSRIEAAIVISELPGEEFYDDIERRSLENFRDDPEGLRKRAFSTIDEFRTYFQPFWAAVEPRLRATVS